MGSNIYEVFSSLYISIDIYIYIHIDIYAATCIPRTLGVSIRVGCIRLDDPHLIWEIRSRKILQASQRVPHRGLCGPGASEATRMHWMEVSTFNMSQRLESWKYNKIYENSSLNLWKYEGATDHDTLSGCTRSPWDWWFHPGNMSLDWICQQHPWRWCPYTYPNPKASIVSMLK